MMAAAWHDLSDLQRENKVHVSAVARGSCPEMGWATDSVALCSPLPKLSAHNLAIWPGIPEAQRPRDECGT